ncbi:chemotaxis protein CheD [Pseudomonas vanderleydeniana]|uniref:Probable chemoreceptor glutamine deamidase CheD n=1 Tax=Pseudomonas vanderleydeniana TaxID=2745495 RepID=A0A9E6PS35_9PSED|nr:chemotaxis protein CheD [Pseudomonas vanderleydeniana]QXI31163.1 chemotaxis protein CheD [Pseudomonas vanderleydeniana]
MRKPKGVIEVFLQPGELYFSDRYTRLRTLLGSCVSIVLWHREALLGGMCHYLLPTSCHPDHKPDGRYADGALHQLLREIRMSGTHARDYRIGLFGGGNMLESRNRQHIGQRNVEAGLALLAAHGLACHAQDVGGEGYRNLIFDVWSGSIALRHPNPQHVANRRNEASSS